MNNPLGFDPSGMSDEELNAKETELNMRIVQAAWMGGNTLIIEQLRAFLNMIERERLERFARAAFEERNALFPEVIETEPDLRPSQEKTSTTRNESRPTRRPMIRRTTTPQQPKDD